MAKLERVTAKVFASDAPADKIGQFGSALAGTKLETGDVSTIQALPAYTEGWSSAVISQRNYPVLQETNGVMKNMTYQTAYIMQNGIAEYDPNTEYYAGSICKGIGNTNQYASWDDENVGNAVTNSLYWKNVTPVNYSNITNCLLEVPQRIKLELVDGAVILKAGSEVIVPNGVNVFNYIKIENDLSFNYSGTGTTDIFLLYNFTSNTLGYALASTSVSGTTAPTDSRLYYDTANNIIDYYNNGNPNNIKYALPIAILSRSDGTITGIKQVFNGMGYIGSTIWVDKGIKGLIPNGRNEDGSLNNIEITNIRVITQSYTSTKSHSTIILADSEIGNSEQYYYDETENYVKRLDNENKQKAFIIGTNTLTQGVISNFQPKLPFRAVDYSDKSTVAGWSMPSQTTYTFTNGASGTMYTMPADGWLYVKATGAPTVNKGKWLYIGNKTSGIAIQNTTNFGNPQESIMPVRKNDVVVITWEDLTLNTVQLYYLQGDN